MLKIRIETKNAAFEDPSAGGRDIEICRCLSNIMVCIKCGKYESDIFDIYGNVTGHFKLIK